MDGVFEKPALAPYMIRPDGHVPRSFPSTGGTGKEILDYEVEDIQKYRLI